MAKKGVKKDIKEEPSKNIPFNPHLQYKQAKAAKAAQEDTRFNRAAYDPRFRDDDEQSSAINLQDDRFNKIFDDTAFNDEYEVDEYGRPVAKSSVDYLAKYYKLSNKEINDKRTKRLDDLKEYGKDLTGEEGQEQDEEQDEEMESNAEEGREVEGEEDSDLEEDEESDDEEASSDDGEDLEDAMKRYLADADEDEEAAMRDDDEVVTNRLALQNMDWGGLTSVDLLAVLHHFAPPGGVVKRVSIYPSDLGRAAMSREALAGPEGVWKDTRQLEVKKGYQGLDEHNLRRHEKNTLRYYYAIAECDSKKTAAHIYDTCDGMEFEDSVNALDLRFVPDAQKFTNEPRDSATRVPDNYTAPAVFTKALGHSKQELSWDKADPKRSALLNTDFSRKQLKDMNYETFVNVINDDEESDESDVGEDVADQEADGEAGEHEAEGAESAEENGHKQNGSGGKVKKENGKENGSTKIKESTVKESDKTVKKKVDPEERKRMKVERTRNKYMGLLTGLYDKQPEKEELKISFDSNYDTLPTLSDDEDESMDKEVTFTPGLDEKARAIMKDKETKALSSWDQYLQKRAEKLKAVHAAKKEKAKSAMEERKQAFVDSKTKKKAPETEEGRRSKAELELLLAGDKEAEAGFNMRDLANEEKNKDKKKKKDKKEKEEKREQTFNVDMNDPRFGAIFNNKEFAIDRSNPEYKSTAVMKAIEKEATSRRYDSSGAPRKEITRKEIPKEPNWDSSRVASLKRKVENFPSTKLKQKRV